jgi:hypothetical protein
MMRMLQEKIMRTKASAIYSAKQTERNSIVNLRYAMGFGQNWTLEMFRISNVLRRSSGPVCRLKDMRGDNRDGQLYGAEQTSVKISRTEYLTDKIL